MKIYMPDLRGKTMIHFYNLWDEIGTQCESMPVRRMEKICWTERGSSDGILEVAYDNGDIIRGVYERY
jgi:hypothetical protein